MHAPSQLASAGVKGSLLLQVIGRDWNMHKREQMMKILLNPANGQAPGLSG